MPELVLICQGCSGESLSIADVSIDVARIMAERDGWQVSPVALCPGCKLMADAAAQDEHNKSSE